MLLALLPLSPFLPPTHTLIPTATMLTPLILTVVAASARAREITFPPVAAIHPQQHSLGDHDIDHPIDISGMQYGGLMTYANLPYAHCLAAEGDEVEPYDIAVIGAPFDTVFFPPSGVQRKVDVWADVVMVDVGRDCPAGRAVWADGH